MQTIRNIPIGCPRCQNIVRGQERPSTRNGIPVTECIWRCNRCGTYIKNGVTQVHEK